MKKVKQIVSVVLCLLMMVCSVPVFSQGADVVDSGTCGENLTWMLTRDYTLYPDGSFYKLTISGTGAMENYSTCFISNENRQWRTNAPWGKYYNHIISAVLEPGVTTIGYCAFYLCSNLSQIIIPESVTRIGFSAFQATGYMEVTIPSSVTEIEPNAFSDSHVKSFRVDPNNPKYASDDRGCLYNKDGGVLIRYPAGDYQHQDFTVPNHVTRIEGKAFSVCHSLQTVTIPNTVTGLYYTGYTFSECWNLKHVVLSDSLKTIPECAFVNCRKLESIVIPKSLTTINTSAFAGCSELQDVYYGGTMTEWSKISIRTDNDQLKNATIHYNYQHEHIAGTPVRENEIPADCTSAATYEAVTCCTICGEELTREIRTDGEPLGHDFSAWHIITAPTCTGWGEQKRVCSRCPVFETEAIAPHGHTEQTYTTPSTCSENGFVIVICSDCKQTVRQEILPRAEHRWGEPIITKNPNCTEEGNAIKTCMSCGSSETVAISALGHTSPDSNGNCTRCGTHIKDVTPSQPSNPQPNPNACKYCGQVHTGPFGWLIKFFHSLLAIFKR